MESSIFDAVIVGGGPAGCQCALWLQQMGFQVALIEKSNHLGGLLAHSPYVNSWIAGVPNWSGAHWADAISKHMQSLPISIFLKEEIEQVRSSKSEFEIQTSKQKFKTKKLVIATGVRPKSGGLTSSSKILIGPGSQIESYDFTKKRVAILGGGDNAMENWQFIQKKNPASLKVFSRTQRARHSLSSQIPSADLFLGNYNLDPNQMQISGTFGKYEADVWVVLYGFEAQIPNAFEALLKNQLDSAGFIKTDSSRTTAIAGLYAIGEVAGLPNPCMVSSMNDGILCAKAIQKTLEGINK